VGDPRYAILRWQLTCSNAWSPASVERDYRVVFAPDRRGRRSDDSEAPAPQPAGDFRGSRLAARLDFELHRRIVAAYPVDFRISCDFNGLQQGKFSLHSISAT
jgi:hypothetical protein